MAVAKKEEEEICSTLLNFSLRWGINLINKPEKPETELSFHKSSSLSQLVEQILYETYSMETRRI